MKVDAHHHVWQVARGDYGWLKPELTALYRDYSLADLRPHLARAGITATVLVQAAPTEAETRFMLDTARTSGGLVRAVVGWTDMMAPDAPDRLAALAAEPLLRGVRPMLQDIPDTNWILDPRLDPAFRALMQLDLRFDALVKPPHLPSIRRLADRHPDLPMVIDHGAKPFIAAATREPWLSDIAALARESRAFCKISGLVTEARSHWHVDDLRPYVEHLLMAFGPDRLVWGSDWPVVNLAGGYAAWRQASDQLLADLAPAERAAVEGGNAARFYGFA